MGAQADAIQMFRDFRSDEWFADAFYSAQWTEEQVSSGGAFGGGSVVQVVHSASILKMGNKDIKNMFGSDYDVSSLYVKAIIEEFGEPEVNTPLTVDGKTYSIASRQYDSVNALIALELVA